MLHPSRTSTNISCDLKVIPKLLRVGPLHPLTTINLSVFLDFDLTTVLSQDRNDRDYQIITDYQLDVTRRSRIYYKRSLESVVKKGRKEKRNTTSLISFGRHYRSLIFRSYKRSYPTNPLSSFSLVFYVESFLRTDDRLRHFLLCPRDCTPQFPTEQDNKHQQYVIFRRISKSPHTVLTRLHHY